MKPGEVAIGTSPELPEIIRAVPLAWPSQPELPRTVIPGDPVAKVRELAPVAVEKSTVPPAESVVI